MNRIIPAVAAILLATSASLSHAAESIGAADRVDPDAYGTPPGESRVTLNDNDPVFTDELIETAADGWVWIRFEDRSQLKITGGTSLVLDDFVYEKAGFFQRTEGSFAIDVTKGVFRFITGRMTSESYEVRTPTALIGVRGTDFIVVVADDGTTTVKVLQGTVAITALTGNATTTLGFGQAVSVDSAGNISDSDYDPPQDDGLDTGVLDEADRGGGGGGGGGGGH